MERLTYAPKEELSLIAQEVIDFLRQKDLLIWQVKEVLIEASKLAEWEKLK